MDFFTQYVNLKDDKNFQAIYFSQVYGTFFSVYARFNLDRDEGEPTAESDSYLIKDIDFKVINYKGVVNVGIVDVEHPRKFMDEVNENIPEDRRDSVKAFKLVMRAIGGFSRRNTKLPQESFNMPVNLRVNPDDTLYFRRVQRHMHVDRKPEFDGLFDSEFFYRDGLNSFKKKPKSPDQKWPKLDTIQFGFNSGPLCPETHNIVM